MPDLIINNLNSVSRSDLFDWCDEYITLNTNKILDLVRNRMKQGKNTEGGLIGVYRSNNYALFKERLNPLAHGTVDLFLTGDLQKELTIKRDANLATIFSTNWKYDMLFEKYGGGSAFGLTQIQHDEIISEMLLFCYEKIITKILS